MEKKHTPGSWVVHHDFDDGLYRVVLDENGPGQCVIAELEVQQEECANAHLIAACPRMFDYILKKAESGDSEAKNIIQEARGAKG